MFVVDCNMYTPPPPTNPAELAKLIMKITFRENHEQPPLMYTPFGVWAIATFPGFQYFEKMRGTGDIIKAMINAHLHVYMYSVPHKESRF